MNETTWGSDEHQARIAEAVEALRAFGPPIVVVPAEES